MNNQEILKNKEIFLSEARKFIKRDGIENLLSYLENKTDFFEAPASQLYLAEAGGNCKHSLNVYNRLAMNVCEEKDLSLKDDNRAVDSFAESIAIIALFHNIYKCNYYKSNGNGEYEKREDCLGYGQGEESVYILCGFLKLTREEAFAIRFHVGEMNENRFKAFQKYPLAIMLYIANMEAIFLDES